MRSKGALSILVLLIVVGLAGCYGCTSYNGIVASDEAVAQAWADVENQYQRRTDLVPTLMDVVQSAASIDQGLIAAVKDAKKGVDGVRLTDTSDKPALDRYAEAQQQLSSSLSSLTSAIRSDQGLQSIEAHRDLLVQLEGTENRIAVARRNYNDDVAEYNQTVRRFPKNVVAGLFGFEPKPAFTAETK
ncbi:MAG TPA: LemA family protein [Rhodothermales bacterium]|nr:LemA family protein [Rhodothermales bacterium]